MIVGDGLREIAEDFKTSLANGVVGSGSASVSDADTDLQSEVASVSLDDTSSSNKTVTTKTLINTATANGSSLYEQGTKKSDGTLLTRVTHPVISKTANDEVTYFDKVVFKRG